MTTPPPQQKTGRSWAYCSWHDAYSDTARLVRIIEQGSGVGHGLFACETCRAVNGLTPVADLP